MDVIHYPTTADVFSEMLKMARMLGITDLIVLDLPPELLSPKGPPKPPTSKDSVLKSSLRVYRAVFVTPSNLSKLSNRTNQEFVFAPPEKACFEHPRVNGIIGAEGLMRKDRLHQRDSGINLTLASIAGKQKKVLLLDLALLGTDRKQQVLGRFIQNARLAVKARVPILIVSGARTPYQMRSPTELSILARWFGARPALTREAETLLRSHMNSSMIFSTKDNKVYK